LRATIRVDRDLYGDSNKLGESKDVTKFKLPAQPVIYIPQGMTRVAVEKQFEISPKALFHVMFGDKSAVWQLLYHERRAQCNLHPNLTFPEPKLTGKSRQTGTLESSRPRSYEERI
jgi:hypothetical protein